VREREREREREKKKRGEFEMAFGRRYRRRYTARGEMAASP